MWFFRRKIKAAEPVAVVEKQKNNNGLALGGGGARGIAHIGAIKAFEENGIEFNIVAGTSAGALVGSLYCAGISSDQMLEFARTLHKRDLVTSKLPWIASNSMNIETAMTRFIGDIVFDDLQRSFSAVTVDIKSGNEVILDKGSVARAVTASSAVPGVFTPVEWDNYRLIDGGLLNTIPSDVCRKMGADNVIAIDINSTRGFGTESLRLYEILKASFRIAMKATAVKGQLNSDIIVSPDMHRFSATDLSGIDSMYEEGYIATVKRMGEIKKLLGI